MNHIKNVNDNFSYCGELLNENNFYFKDIEQATINGLYGNRIICGYCADMIIRCLEMKGKHYDTSETYTPGS